MKGWTPCRPHTADLSPLGLSQSAEKKTEASGPEAEPCPELHVEALETLTRASATGAESGGVRPEQPFIVLGQEEYGEHHSSIMHCRWAGVWGSGGGPSRQSADWGGGAGSRGSLACQAVCVKVWQTGGPLGGMVPDRPRSSLQNQRRTGQLLLAWVASLSFLTVGR